MDKVRKATTWAVVLLELEIGILLYIWNIDFSGLGLEFYCKMFGGFLIVKATHRLKEETQEFQVAHKIGWTYWAVLCISFMIGMTTVDSQVMLIVSLVVGVLNGILLYQCVKHINRGIGDLYKESSVVTYVQRKLDDVGRSIIVIMLLLESTIFLAELPGVVMIVAVIVLLLTITIFGKLHGVKYAFRSEEYAIRLPERKATIVLYGIIIGCVLLCVYANCSIEIAI